MMEWHRGQAEEHASLIPHMSATPANSPSLGTSARTVGGGIRVRRSSARDVVTPNRCRIRRPTLQVPEKTPHEVFMQQRAIDNAVYSNTTV